MNLEEKTQVEATSKLFPGGALRVREAAALAGVCGNTIRRLMRDGDLPYVRFGQSRAVRVAYDDIQKFVARQREASSVSNGL